MCVRKRASERERESQRQSNRERKRRERRGEWSLTQCERQKLRGERRRTRETAARRQHITPGAVLHPKNLDATLAAAAELFPGHRRGDTCRLGPNQ